MANDSIPIVETCSPLPGRLLASRFARLYLSVTYASPYYLSRLRDVRERGDSVIVCGATYLQVGYGFAGRRVARFESCRGHLPGAPRLTLTCGWTPTAPLAG